MTLQEILYGAFEPPKAIKTTTHRIGFAGSSRYIAPSNPVTIRKMERKKNPSALNPSEERLLKLLKQQVKPVSAVDLEKKLPWTRNHCSIILTAVFKKGFLNRVRISRNGTRLFLYTVKKELKDAS